MAPTHEYVVFAGSANRDLATAIANHLGVQLASSTVERFPDGELSVELLQPVRRKEVFVVQPTSPPVNDHLMELLAFADACRRAAAQRITAIVPYFGYARSDKRHGRREPITASMVANLMWNAGINHLVVVDLHAPQIEGFFPGAVDSVTAVPILTGVVAPMLSGGVVVVSPDAGRVKMASRYAQLLGAPVAVLHKQRQSGSETAVTHLVGDVQDRSCLIIDDIISTGGTIARSVDTLLAAGARPDILIAASHGVLLPGARAKLSREGVRGVLVTDTVAVQVSNWPQLQVVSVAPLIAATIQRFMADGSISDLI